MEDKERKNLVHLSNIGFTVFIFSILCLCLMLASWDFRLILATRV